MSHNNQRKIAFINDFTGFGKCSITVALPVISALKVQCCPVLTSVFSNHTAYPEYFFEDYTDKMQDYIDNWKKLDLKFEGISSGFLGSVRQIEIVKKFINDFKDDKTVVVVDPVMGDDGIKYKTYTYGKIKQMAEKLSNMGPSKVVITGIVRGQYINNYVYQKGNDGLIIKTKVIGETRSGTGDIFSAIIAADAVNNVDFISSVKKASGFIKKCIEVTNKRDIPPEDGVCFEDVLKYLK